jgi:hypothetical protein
LSENNFQQVADMSRLQWRSIFLFILSLYFCQSAFASVVMTGSRVIYPSDAKSVDLKLRNDDDFPYVIQAWFDSGDPSSTPETGKAPFIVTPPTFRIAAKEGKYYAFSLRQINRCRRTGSVFISTSCRSLRQTSAVIKATKSF